MILSIPTTDHSTTTARPYTSLLTATYASATKNLRTQFSVALSRVLLVAVQNQSVLPLKGSAMLLLSTGQIAQEIGHDRDRVTYTIRKAGIKPVGRVGLVGLFLQSA